MRPEGSFVVRILPCSNAKRAFSSVRYFASTTSQSPQKPSSDARLKSLLVIISLKCKSNTNIQNTFTHKHNYQWNIKTHNLFVQGHIIKPTLKLVAVLHKFCQTQLHIVALLGWPLANVLKVCFDAILRNQIKQHINNKTTKHNTTH